jgi:undecaprenyl-phosphate 4-deoxy-4-formamido-L-arabinose transferase
VAKADEGYDVVGTVRQNRQDSLFRKLASRTINRLIQRTTGKAMGDYGCMLRAYRRHIDAMLHCHERSTFIPILPIPLPAGRLKFRCCTPSASTGNRNTALCA